MRPRLYSSARGLLVSSLAVIILAAQASAQQGTPAAQPPVDATPSPTASNAPFEQPAPQPARLPGRRVRVPRSIDATGKKDVSARLQRFVDRTKDNTTIVFPEGAVYRLASGGIRVSGRRDLAFVGHGATLRSQGCGYLDSLFVLGGAGTASSRIIIEGLTLEGDNPHPATDRAHRGGCQHQHGVASYRSRHIEVRDVTIRRTHGD